MKAPILAATLLVADVAPAQERRPGSVAPPAMQKWAPDLAGVKHWHGAIAAALMRHFAVSEAEAGENVEWLEPVSDAQYAAR